MNQFWWSSSSIGGGGIRWRSWKELCKAKALGGLGFRSVREFNCALIRKQAWRIAKNTNLLVYQVLKARYFPGRSFFHARMGSSPSYIWRSLLN